MIVKTNQTAIDVSFDICGSLAGFPTLLSQLPTGERIGFDDVPTLDDVADIGQTWTPELEGVDIDVAIKIYIAETLSKAPFGTDLKGLENAITWGENLLPTLFDYTGYTEFDYLEDEVPDELKYDVHVNQTPVDVSFDLTGSIAGLILLFDQLPVSDRVGFDTMPEVWEDINVLGQTWTPSLQQQSFQFSLPVYSLLSVQKARYNTDVLGLVSAITWGNDFLAGAISSDNLVDDSYDFLVDDYDNYLTT